MTSSSAASGDLDLRAHELGRLAGPGGGALVIAVGGLHGNEPSGVRALTRILDRLAPHSEALRGEFLAFAGNLDALRAGERFIDRDLNGAGPRRARRIFRGGPKPPRIAPRRLSCGRSFPACGSGKAPPASSTFTRRRPTARHSSRPASTRPWKHSPGGWACPSCGGSFRHGPGSQELRAGRAGTGHGAGRERRRARSDGRFLPLYQRLGDDGFFVIRPAADVPAAVADLAVSSAIC